MRLRRLFLTLSFLLSITVVLITASSLGGAWLQLNQARDGMQALQQLKSLYAAYEMVSRERGPANAVLGDDLPSSPDKQQALLLARQTTDNAFELLLEQLETDREQAHGIILGARGQLQRARQAVDQEAAKERDLRNTAKISGAVNQMIDVINDMSPALLALTNDASASFPVTTDALLAAVQAAALREYAGQLGSQLTAALTTRQPLKTEELAAINRLRGRIEQLREQLRVRATALEQHQSVRTAIDIMTERYFESAIPFVEQLVNIGLYSGDYQVDTAQFAARYVPDMDSIVSLRSILLNDAIRVAQSQQQKTVSVALKMLAGSILLFTLLGLTWWLLHRRVVLPLTKTTELIVTIAGGQLNVQIPVSKYRDEVADMLGAIAVLRDNSIARNKAEKAIRQMAFYDPLTGLPNRRLLEDRLQQELAMSQRDNKAGALLFIDLDRFKQVNDEHGHEAGDWLLRQVAMRMQDRLRDSDTAARIGGDEFIVLLPDVGTIHNATRVAEKIRQQTAQPFIMEDGTELNISSSIGVVLFPLQAATPDDLLRHGDIAMYAAKKQGRNKVIPYSPILGGP